MSHLDELYLRYDGPIPRCELRDAIAADHAAASIRRRPFRIKIINVRWKPAGIIERMAQAMVEVARVRGLCLERDLKRRGHSSAHIATYGAAARLRAIQIQAAR